MKLRSVISKPLSDLAPGDSGRVVSAPEGSGIELRLVDLGFVAGTALRVIRRAPLGDPVEIEIRGTRICLRRQDLIGIRVEVDG